MTGDDIDAARALRIGLVEEVHDTHAALFEAAKDLARRIAANPPLVVQGVKQVLSAASERAAAESLRTVALWNAAFLPSHDLREAMASFMEKRPPKFEGR
jgi:enoyl-CoA hydratase